MRKLKIGILGCGPAGIFAAHAVAEAGHTPVILSKSRKSFMRGAQYLHMPIPGLSGDPFKVEYKLNGTVDGYREKVYGDMGDILVSPSTLVGVSDAWDIREAYDAGWELYKGYITNVDLSTEAGRSVLSIREKMFDATVSTIPANALCDRPNTHSFASQNVWVTETIKSLGDFEFGSDGELRDNLVVCSGEAGDWWYRQSRIHGWENTEFPDSARPNYPGKVHAVSKPLSTTCTCHPDIIRMGRYGRWEKGVLSHESYFEAAEVVQNILDGKEATA